MKLTDQMFNIDYIAQNLGSNCCRGDAISEESITLTSGGTGTLLVDTPVAFGNYGTVGWVSLSGSTNPVWTKVTFTGQAFYSFWWLIGRSLVCKIFCNRFSRKESYCKFKHSSRKVVTVVLTSNLYNGNPSDLKSARKIGKLTIKVPALQLDGNQEISMTMTGVSQTDLTGSALAIEGDCGADGYFCGNYTKYIQYKLVR